MNGFKLNFKLNGKLMTTDDWYPSVTHARKDAMATAKAYGACVSIVPIPDSELITVDGVDALDALLDADDDDSDLGEGEPAIPANATGELLGLYIQQYMANGRRAN